MDAVRKIKGVAEVGVIPDEAWSMLPQEIAPTPDKVDMLK